MVKKELKNMLYIRNAILLPYKLVWYWEEKICKQMEISYLLTVLLSIPQNKLPYYSQRNTLPNKIHERNDQPCRSGVQDRNYGNTGYQVFKWGIKT